MKLNLNNILINSSQYVDFLTDKYSISIDHYNDYESSNMIIKPYLYTLSIASLREQECFWTFYINYLDKSEILIGNDHIQCILNDNVLMLTFIIAAQYYFL